MNNTPLDVVIVWHMHQPYYKDPVQNEYVLPWTYLHGIKDYFDMPAIVEDTPGAKAVFNLVPSLIEQLLEYAAGTAVDPFLEKGKANPADLNQEDRLFILEHFFSANRQRMIEPYPRYLELLYLAGEGKPGSARQRVSHFSDQDLLDLQVWFFLAWTGEAARLRYPLFAELVAKGRGFTPADKEQLFRTQQELLQAIIPLYRKLHMAGRIELAVSPYYHPILPLLCDLRTAKTAMPRVTLPDTPFRHAADARAQICRALDYFQVIFDCAPCGMWPSEGSVSDETLALIAGCGLSWVATDENILARSLENGLGNNKERLYRPWRITTPSGDLGMFFRDHQLSDLIGFTYSQWDPQRAADDFCHRLHSIQHRLGGGRHVASIILDGENAWEYYSNNAYDFLQGMYRSIAASSLLNLALCSEVMENGVEKHVLHGIYPGSWINADYGIWIGHPEENRAWELLAEARDTIVTHRPELGELLEQGIKPKGLTEELIFRSLYAAEGSDWFWWYGDDHFSPHSDRFDLLFRRHLINVYRLLGQEPPTALYQPIKKKSPAGMVRKPASFISPTINGKIADYFEWIGAGLYDLTRQGSAMHSSDRMLQSFYFGYNQTAFFIRLDGVQELNRLLRDRDILNLHLTYEREYRLPLMASASEGFLQIRENNVWNPTSTCCRWKIGRICEVQIPLAILGLLPGAKLFASVSLQRDNEEIGRWPTDAQLLLAYEGAEIELNYWVI